MKEDEAPARLRPPQDDRPGRATISAFPSFSSSPLANGPVMRYITDYLTRL